VLIWLILRSASAMRSSISASPLSASHAICIVILDSGRCRLPSNPPSCFDDSEAKPITICDRVLLGIRTSNGAATPHLPVRLSTQVAGTRSYPMPATPIRRKRRRWSLTSSQETIIPLPKGARAEPASLPAARNPSPRVGERRSWCQLESHGYGMRR
jgi:hypothetical protein